MENSTEPPLAIATNINTNGVSSSIPNRDAYVARIENTMAAIEDQNLTHDRRYVQLSLLKTRLEGTIIFCIFRNKKIKYFLEGLLAAKNNDVNENEKSNNSQKKTNVLTPEQLNHLKAQVSVYKMLARNDPISKSLMNQVYGRNVDDSLPMAYEYPSDIGSGEKLPYDLVKVLSIHQQRASTRITNIPVPAGVDPQIILKERENRFNIF